MRQSKIPSHVFAHVCVYRAWIDNAYGRTTDQDRREEDTTMSEKNKVIVARWFTEFWGNPWNPAVVDELAAPDIRFEYSMHAPRRGREDVKNFAAEFRAAFPDLNFWGTADL